MIDPKIIEDIKNQRCVLFLGPLMTSVRFKGRETSYTEMVCSHVAETLVRQQVITNDQATRANPYYLMEKYINFLGDRKKFGDEFATLNRSFVQGPSFVYYRLSKLPFNTIINFGYDHLMDRVLHKGGYEFHFAYYNYSGDREQYLKDRFDDSLSLDTKTQLVYNLLGSIDNTQSHVLTENDQLEFMRQIAGDRKLPDNVLSRIRDDKEGKSYIFLGFNFEEWPFRFLLDLLDVPKKMRSSASPQLGNYNIALMTQEFYQDRFGLKFLEASPIEFARELIGEYNKSAVNHKFGFVSAHESDEELATTFYENLRSTGLGRRIRFWDRKQLLSGDLREQRIKENLARATIYIPFISKHFIRTPELKNELKEMMARPEVMIFPVMTRNCDYQFEFPELKRRSALMLPKDNSWLVTALKPLTEDDYDSMIRKINSKIR